MSRISFYFGSVVLLMLLCFALFADTLCPESQLAQNLSQQLKPPMWPHLFGRNHQGQDLFAVMVHGSRASLLISIGAVLLSLTLGTIVGLVSGYHGGAVDRILSRFVDVILAFPGILLAIAVSAVLGPSTLNVIIALSVSGWVPFSRLARAQALSLREREYVVAAKGLGASSHRVVIKHILPNLGGSLMVQATFALAAAILAEASLSFLGLGVPSHVPSWGKTVADGTRYLLAAPHLATIPGFVIMLTVLSLHFVGDALRGRWYGR